MRRTTRQVARPKVPNRLRTLFHDFGGLPFLPPKFQRIHTNPGIFLIHEFLSDTQLDYMNKVATLLKFNASFTESECNEEIVSAERTSTFLHLTKAQDSVVRAIEQKAADLVGLNPQFVEPLQIVAYTNGQQFSLHHDAGTLQEDGSVSIVAPRRYVTLFVYLNTLPEDQGHTEFPKLGISVRPQRGMALLFCNVKPDGTADHRTVHQANPVESGLCKYGLNIWIGDTNMSELSQRAPTFKMSKLLTGFSQASSAFAKADREMEQFIQLKEFELKASECVSACSERNNGSSDQKLTVPKQYREPPIGAGNISLGIPGCSSLAVPKSTQSLHSIRSVTTGQETELHWAPIVNHAGDGVKGNVGSTVLSETRMKDLSVDADYWSCPQHQELLNSTGTKLQCNYHEPTLTEEIITFKRPKSRSPVDVYTRKRSKVIVCVTQNDATVDEVTKNAKQPICSNHNKQQSYLVSLADTASAIP